MIRRQWYGFPCYAEKEEIPEMGERRARTRKGRLEGGGETYTGFEESREGA